MNKKYAIIIIALILGAYLIGGILMATYGYDEAKCEHEIYTKNDYAVLEGTITIKQNTVGQIVTFEYPEGFTQDNTVVISKSSKDLDQYANNVWWYEVSYTDDGKYVYDIIQVNLFDNEIEIGVHRPSSRQSYQESHDYKVVLMKYKD